MTCPHPKARMLFAFLAAFSLAFATPAAAQPGAGQAAAQSAPSPFLGQWELDLTRMPDTYGPPPKRVATSTSSPATSPRAGMRSAPPCAAPAPRGGLP